LTSNKTNLSKIAEAISQAFWTLETVSDTAPASDQYPAKICIHWLVSH